MTQLVRDNSIHTLHVRFDGRSEEMPLATLRLNEAPTDAQIKQALAAHYDLPAGYFDKYVVVRHSEAIVVRPEAIYG